jgi:hypothetical protein
MILQAVRAYHSTAEMKKARLVFTNTQHHNSFDGEWLTQKNLWSFSISFARAGSVLWLLIDGHYESINRIST